MVQNICVKKSFSFLFLVAFVMTVFTGSVFAAECKEIIILHTNDMHGRVHPFFDKRYGEKGAEMGGLIYLAPKIQEMRCQYGDKAILLDAGDISQGTPISNLFFGEPMSVFMNYVKYDASAYGNHEFDWSYEQLQKTRDGRKFPVLAANVVEVKTGCIPDFIQAYTVVERNGMRIGIIGLATPETKRMTFPKNTEMLDFTDPKAAVDKYQKILRQQGVNVIGVLSHLGYEKDQALAQQLSGISFIVGGHTHTTVPNPQCHNGIPVMQAGQWGQYLGFGKIMVDPDTGKVESFEGKLLPVLTSEIKPDAKLAAMIKPYDDQVKEKMSEVLGELTGDATNTRVPKAGDNTIGNLVTDILREKEGADVMFINSHGLRSNLAKGPLTRESVFMLLPFDNTMVTYDLKGDALQKALEYYVDRPSYTQMSGVVLDYDSKAPKGQRVKNVIVDGKPIDPAKTYKVASIDYLFMVSSKDAPFIRDAANLKYGREMKEVFEEYIKEKKVVNVPEGIRIRVINDDPSNENSRH